MQRDDHGQGLPVPLDCRGASRRRGVDVTRGGVQVALSTGDVGGYGRASAGSGSILLRTSGLPPAPAGGSSPPAPRMPPRGSPRPEGPRRAGRARRRPSPCRARRRAWPRYRAGGRRRPGPLLARPEQRSQLGVVPVEDVAEGPGVGAGARSQAGRPGAVPASDRVRTTSLRRSSGGGVGARSEPVLRSLLGAACRGRLHHGGAQAGPTPAASTPGLLSSGVRTPSTRCAGTLAIASRVRSGWVLPRPLRCVAGELDDDLHGRLGIDRCLLTRQHHADELGP